MLYTTSQNDAMGFQRTTALSLFRHVERFVPYTRRQGQNETQPKWLYIATSSYSPYLATEISCNREIDSSDQSTRGIPPTSAPSHVPMFQETLKGVVRWTVRAKLKMNVSKLLAPFDRILARIPPMISANPIVNLFGSAAYTHIHWQTTNTLSKIKRIEEAADPDRSVPVETSQPIQKQTHHCLAHVISHRTPLGRAFWYRTPFPEQMSTLSSVNGNLANNCYSKQRYLDPFFGAAVDGMFQYF